MYVENDEVSRFFYCMSSNLAPREVFTRSTRLLLERLPFEQVFKLFLVAYLHYNFLGHGFGRRERRRALDFAGVDVPLSPRIERSIDGIFAAALDMNPYARTRTAEFYMRSIGIRGYLETVSGLDLHAFLGEARAQALVARLAGVLEHGALSPKEGS